MTLPLRRFVAPAVILVTLIGCQQRPPENETVAPAVTAETTRTAVATVSPIADVEVNGRVTFESLDGLVRVEGTIRGLSDGKHGFHVHAGSTCTNRGGHFNPTNTPHGSPDEPSTQRHVGDLGNLVSEDDTARYERVDRVIPLSGPQSIVGHALVVHQGEDEYIPQPSGNSGTEIGCGVIELQDGTGE